MRGFGFELGGGIGVERAACEQRRVGDRAVVGAGVIGDSAGHGHQERRVVGVP
jgi:hypothetical protein